MPRKKDTLFKALYYIPQSFYSPYTHQAQYSIKDYEVLNYPVIRLAWLQRQAFLLSMELKLFGDLKSKEYEIIQDFFNNYDDEIVKLIAYLHEAILFGISVVEVVWDEETLYPKRFIPIPRYLVSVKENGFFVNDYQIDGVKYLYAQNVPTADQPYGFALLNILKPMYAMVRKVWEYWGNYIRTYAMPTIIFELDTNALPQKPDENARIMAELEKLKNIDNYGTLIITKDLLTWKTIEPSRAGAENFESILEHIHRQMILSILGQELTTTAQTSSYALGKIHYEILRHLIIRDSKIIADTLNNQLIPAILTLHGIETPNSYPYIQFEFPITLSVDDILKLTQAGIPLSPSDIQRLLGVDLGFQEEKNE